MSGRPGDGYDAMLSMTAPVQLRSLASGHLPGNDSSNGSSNGSSRVSSGHRVKSGDSATAEPGALAALLNRLNADDATLTTEVPLAPEDDDADGDDYYSLSNVTFSQVAAPMHDDLQTATGQGSDGSFFERVLMDSSFGSKGGDSEEFDESRDSSTITSPTPKFPFRSALDAMASPPPAAAASRRAQSERKPRRTSPDDSSAYSSANRSLALTPSRTPTSRGSYTPGGTSSRSFQKAAGWEQVQQRMSNLKGWQAELEARERNVQVTDEKAKQLLKQMREVKEMGLALKQRQHYLEREARSLVERENKLTDAKVAFVAKKEKLRSLYDNLVERENTLADKVKREEARVARLGQARIRDVEEREGKLQAKVQQIKEFQSKLVKVERRLKDREGEVADRSAGLDERQQELIREAERLRELEDALGERDREFERTKQQFAQDVQRVQAQLKQQEDGFADREAGILQQRARNAEVAAAVERIRDEHASEMSDVQAEREALARMRTNLERDQQALRHKESRLETFISPFADL